tara:strand:+ start:1030 stop:1962 length:933 start_codon:yes stop_codon:yes gene_type:complete
MNSSQQNKIYGHDKILLDLIELEKKNKLPNKILLSGKKSIGKSTLAYHLINFIFSKNEEYKYDTANFTINPNNKSHVLVNNNTHPNLFRLFLKDDKKNIEVSDIRNLINFTNLSSLSNQKKIVLIDDIEHLSINSVNALLKIIEEPNDNTYFILINNLDKKIKDTLKSRCIEFKLSINKNAIRDIINDLYPEVGYDSISNDFIHFSNSLTILIDFLTICINEKIDFNKVSIEVFLKYIFDNNLYKKKDFKKVDFKNFIEIFFLRKVNNLPNEKLFKLYSYFNKKYEKFNKYNLDMESYFLEFNSKLLHEK